MHFCTGGRMLQCPGCGGTAVTVEMLRRFAPKERVDHLWRDVMARDAPTGRPCSECGGPLHDAEVEADGTVLPIEACPRCHVVWFDANELHAFSPDAGEPSAEEAEHLGIHSATPVVRMEVWRLVSGLRGILT